MPILSSPANRFSLIADIGGTNTRIALAEGPKLVESTIRRYRNADHGSFGEVLEAFFADEGRHDCIAAGVAVAGPVRDGKAAMTNLDWKLDRDVIRVTTQAETVTLLNDMQAQGHSLGHLHAGALRPLLSGPDGGPHSAQLVVNVGTGFNASPVYNTETGRYVPPSEAGHVSLPVRSEADLALARFVEEVHGFPAVEDVLSGRGLAAIDAWLSRDAGEPRSLSPAQVMAGIQSGEDARARAAGEVFARILGAVTGDLALMHLPFGGICLVGGVARHFAPLLVELGFADAFLDKGRFAGFMKNFRIDAVEDDYAALIGIAAHLDALRQL